MHYRNVRLGYLVVFFIYVMEIYLNLSISEKSGLVGPVKKTNQVDVT